MKLLLEIILLVALPYGTAFLMGALAERLGGKTLSGWAAVGGLALGIYFFHKSLDIIIAS
ncbi:MAG TPA: hypothetical protein VIK28_09320 [Sedimentisphaerales bacterium]|jgi:hypothetical protein|nr:hypothetical protein [Pseudolabrys sp.]